MSKNILKGLYKTALGTALGLSLMYGLPRNSYADGMPTQSPIGSQGIVNNNPNQDGNCADGYDNDGDNLIDRQDPECYDSNKKYNPKLNEDGKDRKIPPTPTQTTPAPTPPTPTPSPSEQTETPEGENINSKYGGNLTMFYTPVESVFTQQLNNDLKFSTTFKGNLLGTNVYARIPVNGKLRLIITGKYSNLEGDITDSGNSSTSLSLETQKYKAGITSQFDVFENGTVEAGIGYENQTTKVKDENQSLEQKLSDIELSLRAWYEFSRGNLKYGPIAGGNVTFSNYNQNSESINLETNYDKKPSTINGEMGGFIEGNNWEGVLTLNYNQSYDNLSDSTLSGVTLCPQIKVGDKTFFYAGSEFSVANNGLDESVYLIGLGQRVGPFVIRGSYFNGTKTYDSNIAQTQTTTDNGFVFSFGINSDDGVKSILSPLNAIRKTR